MNNNKTELTFEELEKLHTTFIEIAAHKFLSPLTIISWNVELLLKNADLPSNVKSKLLDIDTNTKKLKDLSNTLIKISELKDEVNTTNTYDVDLHKLVEEVIKEYEDLFFKKKIKTRLEIKNLVTSIPISESMFKECIRSIIENALLYGDNSTELLISSSVNGSALIFDVLDYGIRIPEDELHIIPQMFYRAKTAQLSEVKGNGLSLYYVKLILDKVNGKIELTNIKKGMQIRLIVPIK